MTGVSEGGWGVHQPDESQARNGTPTYEQNRFCIDSDCGGIAEPEEDLAEGGVLKYWACRSCGMEFGYELVKDEAAAGNCSMGIPEDVRRAASLAPKETGVFLGSTISRRPQ